MQHLNYYIALIQACLVVAGCAQLPEYAKPYIVEVESQPGPRKQGFTYRQLTVDDFQAPSLPENLEPHAQNIAAHACCRIQTTGDARFKITRGYLNQQAHYFGSIEHVAFEAIMMPDCSWLNPDVSEKELDYVLQHEQIHFALMEIAARKLNRESQQEAKTFIAIQSTYPAVRDEIAEKINGMVRSANEEVLEDHMAFDKATSLFHDPASQQQWLERVQRRLLSTKSAGGQE